MTKQDRDAAPAFNEADETRDAGEGAARLSTSSIRSSVAICVNLWLEKPTGGSVITAPTFG